jgi:hypothetical protein
MTTSEVRLAWLENKRRGGYTCIYKHLGRMKII